MLWGGRNAQLKVTVKRPLVSVPKDAVASRRARSGNLSDLDVPG